MNKKILILYSYSEYGKKPDIKIKNTIYFLKKAIILSDNIDYYFIINGDIKNKEIKILLNNIINKNFYIKYRENKGYDFGAYSDTILNLDYNKYHFFFFINDSVRGPFIPFWSSDKNWVKIFTNLINDRVKIVGPTMNYYRGNPHINSEFFVLDKIGLKLCIENNIFSTIMINNFINVVNNCEIKMSNIILSNGFNIKSMCEAYKNVDFTIHRGDKYRNSSLNANIRYNGDPLYANSYYERNINIYEVIFIKANRNIDNYLIDKYTEWHLHGNIDYK